MMSQEQAEIQEIEVEQETLRAAVKFAEDLRTLMRTPEFKRVFDEGYFKDEASRMCLLMDDPALPEDLRKHLMKDMSGPGALKRFFSTTLQLGMSAEESLAANEQTLEELRAGYANADVDEEDLD